MDYKLKDHYFKKAKEEGFRSRAAYKLIEMNNKHRIIRRGSKVLDLGSAPGGWLQVALNSCGQTGFVWGVDKVDINLAPRENLVIIKADVENPGEIDLICENIKGKVDAVISDMSPKLSGIRYHDDARILELGDIALTICKKLLRKKGDFLFKTFHSDELANFRKRINTLFDRVVLFVPEATRRSSSETYILGRGFRP